MSVLIVSFKVVFLIWKETYKRDIQTRHTNETYKRHTQKSVFISICPHTGLFYMSVLRVSFKVVFLFWEETYKRDIQKTHTKVSVRIDLSTYGSLLYVCFNGLFQSCLSWTWKQILKRDLYIWKETCKRDLCILKLSYKTDIHTTNTYEKGLIENHYIKVSFRKEKRPTKETYICEKIPT